MAEFLEVPSKSVLWKFDCITSAKSLDPKFRYTVKSYKQSLFAGTSEFGGPGLLLPHVSVQSVAAIYIWQSASVPD